MLYKYYDRYIKNAINSSKVSSPQNIINWKDQLDSDLENYLNRNVYIKDLKDSIQIFTANRYEAFFEDRKKGSLKICGILSGKEFDYASQNSGIFKNQIMQIDLHEGRRNNYDTIWGTLSVQASNHINDIKAQDHVLVKDALFKFITTVEDLKKRIR
jgi:hypothetical protein